MNSKKKYAAYHSLIDLAIQSVGRKNKLFFKGNLVYEAGKSPGLAKHKIDENVHWMIVGQTSLRIRRDNFETSFSITLVNPKYIKACLLIRKNSPRNRWREQKQHARY